MNILVDTHIIVWYLEGNSTLKMYWKEALENKLNQIYFSPISIAEIGIKTSIGKLSIDENYLDLLENLGWKEIEYSSGAARLLTSLPYLHKDPFDRMLISQSLHLNMYFMTSDKYISQYNLNLFK